VYTRTSLVVRLRTAFNCSQRYTLDSKNSLRRSFVDLSSAGVNVIFRYNQSESVPNDTTLVRLPAIQQETLEREGSKRCDQ